MINPFTKRATEYLREDEAAFLGIVSPEPLAVYLKPFREQLYDRLVTIVGTPGSGKTTMAALLEARMMDIVTADPQREGYREIVHALADVGAVEQATPVIAAVRLPLEGEYRDFWELPYSRDTNNGLLMAMIQARSILGLLRSIASRAGGDARVRFIPKPEAEAALEAIGGPDTKGIRERAREVERAVYRISASLVPPAEEDFEEAARRPYRPFDVIEQIEIDLPKGTRRTTPLVILDDAHNLADEQLGDVVRNLVRREIRIARWMMMRLDSLEPHFAFGKEDGQSRAEIKPDRDFAEIFLQNPKDRQKQKSYFRKITKQLSGKYVERHPAFPDGYRSLDDLLSTEPETLGAQQLEKLKANVDRTQRKLGIPDRERKTLEDEVGRYVAGARTSDTGKDVQLAMLRILMNRFAKRQPQGALFDEDQTPPETDVVKAKAGIADGARLHLHHEFNRAFHFGHDAISDASSENTELFLHLASGLVELMETRLIRGRPPSLKPRAQNRELRRRAREIIEAWNFPFVVQTRCLIDGITQACLNESRKPNAWLDAGANAVGVPQTEFEQLLETKDSQLKSVLKFAVAYNALVVIPHSEQGGGGREWCLVRLGGPSILAHGLTLKHGGFLRKHLHDLRAMAGVDT